MANLYGRLRNNAKSNAADVTRTAGTQIRSRLEDWDDSITTYLNADGSFEVYIGEKDSDKVCIAFGKISDWRD